MKKIANFFINFWQAETEVKIRTIALVIALINLVLFLCGKNQITVEAETVWKVITMVVTTVTSMYAWWKNNSITPEAKAADIIMKAAKQTVFEEVAEDEFITEDEPETRNEV